MRGCEAAILIVPPLLHIKPAMMALMLPPALGFVGGALWWAFVVALDGQERPSSFGVRPVGGKTG
jgi:hypothetical protein